MTMLARLLVVFSELPWLMRSGLLIVLAGGGLDLFYHLLPAQWAVMLDQFLGRGAWPVHLVTLMGMVMALAGIAVGRFSMRSGRARLAETERSAAIENVER
jgi:hypothetical protein